LKSLITAAGVLPPKNHNMAQKNKLVKKNTARQTDPGFRRRSHRRSKSYGGQARSHGGQVAGSPGFSKVSLLIKKGVIIPNPSSVLIDPAVVIDQIAPGTIIYPFCRISGAQTSIGPKSILGAEAPVTIDNCQLGSEVKLSGGYFSGATFLDNSGMGSGAHVRPGTLIEEFASGAHAVGLKQTVLFPYVALGSLINFCDCLMAGGTGRKNHGEVGSSYVHFNFTPHHDKATASLIGAVPRGVLLDQPPVFLGGQGGLVGPAQIAFGAIIPAGIIRRKDVPDAGLAGEDDQAQAAAGGFIPGAYRSIDRIIRNNLVYIGNIYALKMWYRHARKIFMAKEKFQSACLAGAIERLESILQERINRLGELADKMPRSIDLNIKAGNADLPYLQQQKDFAGQWAKINDDLSQTAGFEGDTAKRDSFLTEASKRHGQQSYLETIAGLSPKSKTNAAEWLQSIVDRATGIWKTDKQEKSVSHRGHRVHGDKD